MATDVSNPAEQLSGGLKRQITCTSFCKGLHDLFVKHLDRCLCMSCMSRVLMCGNIAHVRSAADVMISADLKIVRKIVIFDLQKLNFSWPAGACQRAHEISVCSSA